MPNDLSASLRDALLDFLRPIEDAAASPAALNEWLATLGHLPAVASDPALAAAAQHAHAVADKLRALDAAALTSTSGLTALLAAGREVAAVLQELRAFATNPARSAFAAGLAEELMASLLASYLRRSHPTAFRVAALLALVDPRENGPVDPAVTAGGVTQRYARTLDRFHFPAVDTLLRDPGAAMRAAYAPNALAAGADAWTAARRLFPALTYAADALGLSSRAAHRPNVPLPPPSSPDGEIVDFTVAPHDDDPSVVVQGDDAAGIAPPAVPDGDDTYFAANDPVWRLVLARNSSGDEIGLDVAVSSAKHPRGVAGLVLTLAGTFNLTETRGDWTLALSSSGALPSIAVGLTGVAVAPGGVAGASGSAKVRLDHTPAAGTSGPAFVFGSPQGTRVELGSLGVTAEASSDTTAGTAASFGVDASNGAIVLVPSDGDGFLSEILPSGGVRAPFDLGLAWSSRTGLALRGGGGLQADVPVHVSVGPITVSSLRLGLQSTADGTVSAELSANVGASLGPVRASVERVGLTTSLSFPTGGGNLGLADVAFGFKAPNGVGLSVDAHGALTGGGYLAYDAARATYSGAMRLTLSDSMTLSAFGMIATRLPDGRPGFSLLVFITAEGFKPIPLGLGLVLQGIGGMLGVNRTFDADVLSAGLKTDTLGALLFPRDPVGNAPALLQALSAAFPVKQGSTLLGLTARITWFTPTLVTMDLALILEIGSRERLLLLGRVSALLPSEDNDLIRLKLDVDGVLDADAGTLEMNAVLVDSRLVHRFPITGSAALRARWQDGPNGTDANAAQGSSFVLAVGGVNPRFTPPTGFPSLDRVAIALTTGKNPRLLCDAYLALTSNTVQFGARASLYAEAVGFSVTGDVSFDALVTLLPPHFVVDFHASVQLKRGSTNLFKVSLDGTLEGPLPLRISAKAKFEILWVSFSVHFDFTLVSGSAAQSVPAVNVSAELTKALADPASWSTRTASAVGHGVALRALPAGTVPILDPLGQLVVRQLVVPLNAADAIDTYGGAPVVGATRFALAGTFDGQPAAPVQAVFAPARFFAMSDDEKVTAPSFQSMDAGLAFGDASVTFDAGAVASADLKYEAITLGPLGPTGGASAPSAAPAATYAMPAESLAPQLGRGAAARAPVRRVGRARFRNAPAAATPPATVAPVAWRIVDPITGAVAAVDPAVATWSEYNDALAAMNRGGARWLMVPAHELVG